MPFGLKNAGVECQRAINFTLEGINGRGVIVYMDDVIIYSQDLTTHKKLFNEVMERFRNANWQVEPSKCNILYKKVKYLGHVISGDGISLDPEKKKLDKPTPAPEQPDLAEISFKDQEPPDKLPIDNEHRPMSRPRQQINNTDIPTPAPRRSTRSKPWLDAPKVAPAPGDKLQSNQPNSVQTDHESSDESDKEVEDIPVSKRPRSRLKPPHEDVLIAPPPSPSKPPPQERLSDESESSDSESEQEEGHVVGQANIVTCKDAIEFGKNILVYFAIRLANLLTKVA
ncbi:hypothetical protein TKK_0019235 [Trichogramma kaykai]